MVAMPYTDMRGSGKRCVQIDRLENVQLMTTLSAASHDGPQRPALSTPMFASENSNNSGGAWSASRQSASDNVESDTEGMQVSGISHLAPREVSPCFWLIL